MAAKNCSLLKVSDDLKCVLIVKARHEAKAMKPTEILRAVGERYSQCSSYSDSGFAEFEDVPEQMLQIAFRTEFIRPDYLRFEWQDYGPRRGKSERFSTLWASENKVLTRRDTSKVVVEKQPSLGLAMAGATGCSAGAAGEVPTLLIAELRTDCKHILLLTDLEKIEQVLEGNQQCYVLKGSLFRNGDHTLWISTGDFSVRRVRIDHSHTAEESERELKAITENTELMARLTERGIAPPKDMKPKDIRFVIDYFYTDVSFDHSIVRAAEPVA